MPVPDLARELLESLGELPDYSAHSISAECDCTGDEWCDADNQSASLEDADCYACATGQGPHRLDCPSGREDS